MRKVLSSLYTWFVEYATNIELLGPEGQTLTPRYWSKTIQPGWTVEIQFVDRNIMPTWTKVELDTFAERLERRRAYHNLRKEELQLNKEDQRSIAKLSGNKRDRFGLYVKSMFGM